jgi:outer membrane receptor protein involved in Fe transport
VEHLQFFAEAERVWQRDMYLNFKPHMLPHYVEDTTRWITEAPDLGVAPSDSMMQEHFFLGEVQRWDSRLWKVRLQANYRLDFGEVHKQDFVIGAEYANSQYFVAYGVNTLYPWQESDDKKWPNTKTHRISIYAQDQLTFLDEMFKLTVGARFNKETYNNANLTPRISLGFEPIKNTVLKFNYTQGFRSLAFDQFAQATESTDPTRMRQFEGGVAQRLSAGIFDALASVTYYNMRKTGAYKRIDDKSGLGVNWIPGDDTTDISGFEGQLKFSFKDIPGNDISGFLGANYVLRELDSTASKVAYYKEYPKYQGKIGISDRIFDLVDLSLFTDITSKLEYEVAQYDTQTGQPGAKELKKQDPTAILNLSVGVGPFELFKQINARVSFQVNNLTNEQYVHVVRRWSSGEGYLQAPRTFSAKAEFSF